VFYRKLDEVFNTKEGTPRLLLSITKGKYLDPEKTRTKKSIKVKPSNL